MAFNSDLSFTNLKKIAGYLPEYGVSTLEAQSTFLALVGVYCQYVPQIKSCEYTTVEQLKNDYPKSFATTDESKIGIWLHYESKQKGTAKDFYNYVYDINNDGSDVGNKYAEDGYKFADCGLLPILGRGQFERLKQLVSSQNKSALDSSQSLIADLKAATEVAVLIFREVMAGVPAGSHPIFFYEACRRFGNIINNDEKAKQAKDGYEFFYGSHLNETFGYSNKTAGSEVIPNTYYGSDQRDNIYGFTDPNGKYPYNRTNGHSTINQLCKGDVRNSIVTLKENQRRVAIPTSDGTKWDQPHSAYAAQYPHNNVKETESGHVEEWDDTPGHERIHWYHRKGTFEEIDQNGTRVVRVVGDDYTIIDRNGFITVEGKASVTVSGNINVYCMSDANIKVEGSANMEVGGSMDVGVANNFQLRCGGDVSVWAEGTLNLQGKKSIHMHTDNLFNAHSKKDINFTSDSMTKISSSQDMHISSVEDVNIMGGTDTNISSRRDMYITSGNDMHVLCKGESRHETYLDKHDKVAGNMNIAIDGECKQCMIGRWYVLCKSNINIYTDWGMYLESLIDTHIKTGGWLATSSLLGTTIDGGALLAADAKALMNLNGGLAALLPVLGATTPKDVEGIVGADAAKDAMIGTKAIQKGMTTPAPGLAKYPNIAPYISVAYSGDSEKLFDNEGMCDSDDAANNLLDVVKMYANEGEGKIVEGFIFNPVPPESIEYVETPHFNEIMNADPSAFTSSYRLSEHFTLGMLFDGGFNNKHILQAQCGLTVNQIVANMAALANNVLEKIIEFIPGGIDGYRKVWNITSGYRQYPSGNKDSDHLRGRAIDIQFTQVDKNLHWTQIQNIQRHVDYDQLFLEYYGKNSVWIHIGYRDNFDKSQNVANRHQAQTYVDHKKYCDGFQLIAKM